jgi:hypothetical protein
LSAKILEASFWWHNELPRRGLTLVWRLFRKKFSAKNEPRNFDWLPPHKALKMDVQKGLDRVLTRAKTKKPPCGGLSYLLGILGEFGAGEGIRTLDPNLGKVVLYP